jgi:hypothetical protein
LAARGVQNDMRFRNQERLEDAAPVVRPAAHGVAPIAAAAVTDPGTERVTPGELAQALTAIEQRRFAETMQRSDTVAIADALEELESDVSPEAVLRQVLLMRESRSVEPKQLARSQQNAVKLAAFVASACLTFVGAELFFRSAPAPQMQLPAPQYPTALMRMAPPAGTTVVNDDIHHAPIRRTLAEIADGHPFHAALGVGFIANNIGLVTLIDYGADPSNTAWMVLKFGGQAYLRAYTAPASDAVLRNSPVTLYAQPNIPGSPRAEQITVPIANLQSYGPTGGCIPSPFTALHLNPDAHLHDTW